MLGEQTTYAAARVLTSRLQSIIDWLTIPVYD
jgi:hypothetical protein